MAFGPLPARAGLQNIEWRWSVRGYQSACTICQPFANPLPGRDANIGILVGPDLSFDRHRMDGAFVVGPSWSNSSWSNAMAREELKWQNIDADDFPAAVKKSFDAMVEAEATFKADLEKLLKNEGHMPEDKFLVISRKGKRLGVAFASTPRGEGGAGSLKFKTK